MLSIAADERAALQFEDLASALDAGLPLDSVAGSGPKNERAIHEALRERGVVLSPTEDTVLLSAWRAGRISDALRARAAERQRRAEFLRSIVNGLRYPLALLLMTMAVSGLIGVVGGQWWFPAIAFTVFALIGFGIFTVWRGLRRGEERWTQMPVLGPIVLSLAELPYLETLHATYAAGVPLMQAHTAAVAAVPVPSLQNRLRIADRILQGGSSLTDSLAQSTALHQETRLLLATGERAGQLEDALRRALVRRRDVASRAIATNARRVTVIVTSIVMITAALFVFTFYANYYGQLRSMMKH